MEESQGDADHAVASHGDQQAGKVDPVHPSLHLQPQQGEVTYVIGAEGEDQDEECVEGDHPEDMFQEDQAAIEAEQSLPSELLCCSVPLHRIPLVSLTSLTWQV